MSNLLGLTTAEPVSTYTNPHGQIDALIAQHGADQIALEDMQYGAMRQYDPYADPMSDEFGQMMIEGMTGGPLGGIKNIAKSVNRFTFGPSMKTLTRPIKDRLINLMSKSVDTEKVLAGKAAKRADKFYRKFMTDTSSDFGQSVIYKSGYPSANALSTDMRLQKIKFNELKNLKKALSKYRRSDDSQMLSKSIEQYRNIAGNIHTDVVKQGKVPLAKDVAREEAKRMLKIWYGIE